MKIKSAKSFRFWYKTKVKEIERNDPTHNENFVGTYHKENGKKTIKGFFEMYHGDKPDIASYLPSILKIAEDGQAIYEFLQNAVDCGSTHFYIFYNEKYFLAINNGSPFDIEGLQSILNIAQTTKKDPDKIGRFGIGFKLAHRLVGKNEGTDELVRQYKGPILFSWAKLEDLESLMRNEQIEPLVPNKANYQEFINSPYLLKLLLTNFPSDPNETVKDISYKDKILFPQSELKELIDYLNENFEIHSDSLKKNVLKQGSLFFIKLGEEKKKLLDKDYSELVNGIQYSMNTLKNLQKVYINSDDIGKIPLQLEVGSIKKGSEEFEKISPEYKEFDIKFAIGFNTINFGNDKSYEKIKLLKEKPNFYKYFPMGDEINGFGFIIHCDSFSNEANRRKLHEDDINRNLFPVFVNHITQRLADYKTKDRNKFLNLYASLLLSDIPDRQNNKWLRPIFYDTLLKSLQNNVPTKNGFSDNSQNVKINKLRTPLNLSDFGLSQIEWFEWDNEADKLLIDEATKDEKLGIKSWDIADIVENANLENINNWIASCDKKTYKAFLKELEERYLRKETKEKICKIKLFKFSDGEFYSFNEVVKRQIVQNRVTFNYGYSNVFFKTYKNEGIANELDKLEIFLSEINISEYSNIFSSLERMPDEKQMYNFIAEKCKINTLSAKEKKTLFLNFINDATKFDNVAESTLKDLQLFCDSNSEIKPLNQLISNIKTPSWLNIYKIKQDEYFPELKPYLISNSEDIFKYIYQQNQDKIIAKITSAEEITSLIKLYQENQKSFFKEFIIRKENNEFVIDEKTIDTYQVQSADKEARKFLDENCADNLFVLPYEFEEKFKDEEGIIKADDLHSLILEFVDIDEHKDILVDIVKYKAKLKFLQKLLEVKFNIETEYTKEHYEYKILDLALNVLKENDFQNFREKVVIENENQDLKLSQIPPFKNKIKIEDCNLSLSKILPNSYKNNNVLSDLIDNFITLGLQKEKLDDLFAIGKIDFDEIYRLLLLELPKPSNNQNLYIVSNSEQLVFLACLKKDGNLFNFCVRTNDKTHVYFLDSEYYLNDFSFIESKTILNYSGINKYSKYLMRLRYQSKLSFREEPIFSEDKFVIPQLKKDLSEDEKKDLIEFIYTRWNEQHNKSKIKKINWSKINDIDSKDILGFNPTISVFPSKYACESEFLPNYLIKWIGKNKDKIDFLTDVGVWTENSIVVQLRKYLSDKIKTFHIKSLAQEIRFNDDETVLLNSFKWLKEKEIKLQSEQQFEAFKKVVEVINENRTIHDLIIEDQFNFDELEENATEWEESYYKNWKEDSDITVLLYECELPKTISLDEIEDYVFYSFYEGNIAFDEENNIYINQNADVKKELRKLELVKDSDFSFDGLWQNKLEGLEKENAQLRKTEGIILKSDFETEEDAEFIQFYKEGYTKIKAHWRSLPNRNELSFNDYFLRTIQSEIQNYKSITVGTEYSNDLSKNDQKEINREAKVIVKEKLESEGFEFTNGIDEFSTINGVKKEGIEYPLVVKSYKNQDEPLKIGANEWIQLMHPNSMFWVYFGNDKIACLKLNELLRKQDNLTISFSTENLDVENRLEKFAELLRYFGNVHFDFHSVKPNNYSTAAVMGNYQFDERKTEEDLSSDDQDIL